LRAPNGSFWDLGRCGKRRFAGRNGGRGFSLAILAVFLIHGEELVAPCAFMGCMRATGFMARHGVDRDCLTLAAGNLKAGASGWMRAIKAQLEKESETIGAFHLAPPRKSLRSARSWRSLASRSALRAFLSLARSSWLLLASQRRR